ncbi:MAG TPA: hypothetical protein VMW82_02280 [Candidatus Paceibacterota bacterium]|nr:hypothetical protein [Candidatus Paceibacterota bacterium]
MEKQPDATSSELILKQRKARIAELKKKIEEMEESYKIEDKILKSKGLEGKKYANPEVLELKKKLIELNQELESEESLENLDTDEFIDKQFENIIKKEGDE